MPAVQAALEVTGTEVRRLTMVESAVRIVLPEDSTLVSPVLATMLLELSSAH